MPSLIFRSRTPRTRLLHVALSALFLGLFAGAPRTSRAEFGAPEAECPRGTSFSGKTPPDDAERGCVDGAGNRQGVWTRWWPNGAKWRDEAYKDGKRHGRTSAWRANGKKLYEAEYKNGFLNGTMTVYHENGQKKVEGAYTFGKPNGRWVAFGAAGEAIGQLLFDAGNVRPRSKGNPAVLDHMPKRLRSDALRTAQAKVGALHEVSRKLVREGRSPRPARLKGDKVAEFDRQSRFLIQTGQTLELYARGIEIVAADAANPVQIGMHEEAELLVLGLVATIDAAKQAAAKQASTSSATGLRQSLAQTALRKLDH
jgi:hypothetical protein